MSESRITNLTSGDKSGVSRTRSVRRRKNIWETDANRPLSFEGNQWNTLLNERRERTHEQERDDLHDELQEDPILGESTTEAVDDMARRLGNEVFNRLVGDPSRLEPEDRKGTPEWVDDIHDALDNIDSWGTLKKQVNRNADLSSLATKSMMSCLKGRIGDIIKARVKQRKDKQKPAEPGKGPSGPGGQPGGAGAGTASGHQQLPGDLKDKLRAALRAGTQKAGQQANKVSEAMSSCGIGAHTASDAGDYDPELRTEFMNKVLTDEDFQELLRRIGRMVRTARTDTDVQRVKGYTEVVDVERGNDIARLLQGELADLMDEDLQWLAMSRIADGSAMQYQLESEEQMGRGPMVVTRDVSGSMGYHHQWTGALVSAMTVLAFRDKRPIHGCTFDTSVYDKNHLTFSPAPTFTVDGDPSHTQTHDQALMSAVLFNSSRPLRGGTDFDAPLRWAMANGALDDRADVVFITDGEASVPADALAQLMEAKSRGMRLYVLLVGGGYVSDALKAIADQLLSISPEDERKSANLDKRTGTLLRGLRL